MKPGILQWKIGNRVVTTLNDGFNPASVDVVQGLSREEAIRIQRDAFRTDDPKITINLFLVESDKHPPVLIDTGMGFIGGETSGRLLSALEAVGVTPEEIGTVLLTHLHPDHCAGLTDGKGNAVFPNAEIVLEKIEHAFWTDNNNFKDAPDEFKGYVALTQGSLVPYKGRIRLFNGETEVVPKIWSVPLYGHTPGHTGYRISSEGTSVLIWGDIVQFQEIQSARPDTGLAFDVDSAKAVETRKDIMTKAASERLLVAGMHIDFPGFSFVRRTEGGFRLVPALWSDFA